MLLGNALGNEQPVLNLEAEALPCKPIHELAEEIWACYPKKENKKEGMEAIIKALKNGRDSQFLQERTLLFAKAVAGKDRQYIPFPATWFNAERFNNDPSTYAANNQGNTQQNPRNFGIKAAARTGPSAAELIKARQEDAMRNGVAEKAS